MVELYDAFTINTILFLEDLGFCKKGEGGPFVSEGRIAPGGVLPVNTNGGGLSYCHPGMYGLLILIEGVRQLRGECGARQVEKHDTAMVHGNGGVLSAQASVILGIGRRFNPLHPGRGAAGARAGIHASRRIRRSMDLGSRFASPG